MLALIQRSLRRAAALLGALALLLVAFQIGLVAVAASIEGRGDFDALMQLVPAFAQQTFGLALGSFAGMAVLGYFDPVPVMAVVQMAIYLGSEPAGDVEIGLVDLLLARPLPRYWIVTRSVVAMTLCILLLILTMAAATAVGLLMFAPAGAARPSAHLVGVMIAHLGATAWCFGGASLAASGWARRRGTAQAPVAITAVGLYLLDVLGESWSVARPFARFSPFHYFHGAAILGGTANTPRDLLVLAAAGGVAVAIGYWKFSGRDL